MRVFLCDDNVGYRILARRVLERAGYDVIGEAENGREAIDLAPAQHPDLLLLDLNMPVLHGFDALPQLRSLMPDARIVVLTTGHAPAERERALTSGADAFVVKPERVFALPGEIAAALSESGRDG